MLDRRIVAVFNLNGKGVEDEPLFYFESESSYLEESGIYLNDCFSPDDDKDTWAAYINYLVEWIFNHRGDAWVGASPVSYEAFCENAKKG